jgi:hypothetical protein
MSGLPSSEIIYAVARTELLILLFGIAAALLFRQGIAESKKKE